ncbi:MAG TPA: hypothetical protein VEW48_27685 [Thermoanaerobaculia bacterium]|nr:hypothetical protein [Thermoanaerobaculia bacterium]
MTKAAQQLLRSFETLDEEDQREVLTKLLRVPLDANYPAPSDDDLRYAADQIFLEYDEREAEG